MILGLLCFELSHVGIQSVRGTGRQAERAALQGRRPSKQSGGPLQQLQSVPMRLTHPVVHDIGGSVNAAPWLPPSLSLPPAARHGRRSLELEFKVF